MVLDRKVRDGLDRADQLVEGFLTLGRAEHGDLFEQGPVALDHVIAAALAEREDERAARQITVQQQIDPVAVRGSPTLLARMVENLVDNALRHNLPGGWLRIGLDAQPGWVRLTIDNDGRLLDPIQVQQLVQPFRRLGAERTGSARGVGLGLSIVSAIVAAHTGTLTLQALPNGGLHVRVDFPPDRSLNGSGR